jgi:hypothetical protein
MQVNFPQTRDGCTRQYLRQNLFSLPVEMVLELPAGDKVAIGLENIDRPVTMHDDAAVTICAIGLDCDYRTVCARRPSNDNGEGYCQGDRDRR